MHTHTHTQTHRSLASRSERRRHMASMKTASSFISPSTVIPSSGPLRLSPVCVSSHHHTHMSHHLLSRLVARSGSHLCMCAHVVCVCVCARARVCAYVCVCNTSNLGSLTDRHAHICHIIIHICHIIPAILAASLTDTRTYVTSSSTYVTSYQQSWQPH